MTLAVALNWLISQIGQHLDYDKQYGQQCVDFFNFFYQFISGDGPYADGYGVNGAKDLWAVPNSRFTYISDSTSLVPQPGDIAIYGKSWGAGYGHVEIVISVDNSGCTFIGENEHGNISEGVVQVHRTWAQMKGLIGVMRFHWATQATNQPQGDNIVIVGDGDNWYGRLNKSMNQSRGRDASRDELTPFVGIDSLHMFEAIEDNPEADAWYQMGLLGRQASMENWLGQLTQYKTSVDQLNDTVTSVTTDDNATKAQLQDALGKVATLTDELKTTADKVASTPASTKTVVADPSYFAAGDLLKALWQKFTSQFKSK